MNTSVSSISFVITAIYTYTFANAVYQIAWFQESAVDITIRPGTGLINVICAIVCTVMALRFFFGNNNYVERLFNRRSSAYSRLFDFVVITLQSLILLGSSYLVRNPPKFILWIGILFTSEVLWYFISLVTQRSAISTVEGRLDRPLLMNEVANFGMAFVCILLFSFSSLGGGWPYVLLMAFLINTGIDLKVNLKSYMGASQEIA